MRKTMISAVVALVALLTPVGASAAPGDVLSSDVTFTGTDGVVLHGTVLATASPERRPGVVMLEGAGNRGREYLMAEAKAYARHGIVTLVYDKRTEGYSLVNRDYGLLADDALAGLRLLRSRPDVDPARVGLWALSEGAFVAPIAANRSDEVRFLVTVGAVGVTPAAQTAWAYGTYLDHRGVSGSLPDMMRGPAVRSAIGAGVFAEAGFDPVPHWERVRQPVLAQWGRLDRDSVPAESSRLIRAALDRGGNTNHTIRVVDDTNHNLHRTAADGFDRRPDLPADYGDVEARWIADPSFPVAGGRAFDPEPAVPTIGEPAWYDSVLLLVGLLVLFVVGAVRRGASSAARWSGVLGAVTVVGTLLYVAALLVTAAKVPGPVLLGRPVAWLVLHLLTWATVVLTLAAGWGLLRRRRRPVGWRSGLLTAAGLVFVPVALHWGLLVP
jgi:hypothetical protein